MGATARGSAFDARSVDDLATGRRAVAARVLRTAGHTCALARHGHRRRGRRHRQLVRDRPRLPVEAARHLRRTLVPAVVPRRRRRTGVQGHARDAHVHRRAIRPTVARELLSGRMARSPRRPRHAAGRVRQAERRHVGAARALEPRHGRTRPAARGQRTGRLRPSSCKPKRGDSTTRCRRRRQWDYLWYLGDSEIYRAAALEDGRPTICCHTHGDVGILRKDARLPLEPGTRLTWSWRVDALPTDLPEDTLPSHDYLSIAVEFDDGQDLTYYWSASLPAGKIFRCPLPTWKDKETHVVQRSGPAELGRWLDESRDLYADYRPSSAAPRARSCGSG